MGLVLFTLFINDLELGVSSVVKKVFRCPKLFRIVKTKANFEECQEVLQELVHKLGERATTWQMKFNVGKCEVIHTETKIPVSSRG